MITDADAYAKAYSYLTIAINAEANGDMGKARMSLAMACCNELKAYGFKATAADLLKTIAPWTVPTVH